MSGNLKMDILYSETNMVIKLIGQIDESADYSKVAWNKVTSTIFDFQNVTLINSTGLQKWITFLEKVPSQVDIKFEKCPLRIVNQINLFPGFTVNRPVRILSFYAPYYCAECDFSQDILLDTEKYFKNRDQISAPQIKCLRCTKEMEFDGIERKFFSFLHRK